MRPRNLEHLRKGGLKTSHAGYALRTLTFSIQNEPSSKLLIGRFFRFELKQIKQKSQHQQHSKSHR
jgi:hypothetical protein